MDRERGFISLRQPVILQLILDLDFGGFGFREHVLSIQPLESAIQNQRGHGFATQDHSWCAFVGETTALCRELHIARTGSDR